MSPKIAWVVLLVSALTDFIITSGTGVMTVLTAVVIDPTVKDSIRPVIFIAPVVGGVVAAARTIQQALKATPATLAALNGKTTVPPSIGG